MGEYVGRISAVWRFPVKSMQGESLPEAVLTGGGIAGDRAYALIDEETGNVVSAKSAKRFPEMFGCLARFVVPPVPGAEHPPVVITLPDGTSVGSDDPDCEQALSRDVIRSGPYGQAVMTTKTYDVPGPLATGRGPRLA